MTRERSELSMVAGRSGSIPDGISYCLSATQRKRFDFASYGRFSKEAASQIRQPNPSPGPAMDGSASWLLKFGKVPGEPTTV